MHRCEVLIGHLFHGHRRCALGEVIELDTRSADACAKSGYVKILPAADESDTDTSGDADGDGPAKPKKGNK